MTLPVYNLYIFIYLPVCLSILCVIYRMSEKHSS
eukprot:UN13096